jgi:hypothetical protein
VAIGVLKVLGDECVERVVAVLLELAFDEVRATAGVEGHVADPDHAIDPLSDNKSSFAV